MTAKQILLVIVALFGLSFCTSYTISHASDKEQLKPLSQKEIIDLMIKNNKKCIELIGKGNKPEDAFYRNYPQCDIKVNV